VVLTHSYELLYLVALTLTTTYIPMYPWVLEILIVLPLGATLNSAIRNYGYGLTDYLLVHPSYRLHWILFVQARNLVLVRFCILVFLHGS